MELNQQEGDIEVRVAHGEEGTLKCPECGAGGSGYDTRERRWRHLDTCQYRTILVARVPRVKCELPRDKANRGAHPQHKPQGSSVTLHLFTSSFTLLHGCYTQSEIAS